MPRTVLVFPGNAQPGGGAVRVGRDWPTGGVVLVHGRRRLTASASVAYGITDPSTPGISYVVDPAAPDGNNGWYRGDVSLAWSVSEPESPNSLVKTGCLDQSITSDQAETTYACSVTSAGGADGRSTSRSSATRRSRRSAAFVPLPRTDSAGTTETSRFPSPAETTFPAWSRVSAIRQSPPKGPVNLPPGTSRTTPATPTPRPSAGSISTGRTRRSSVPRPRPRTQRAGTTKPSRLRSTATTTGRGSPGAGLARRSPRTAPVNRSPARRPTRQTTARRRPSAASTSMR